MDNEFDNLIYFFDEVDDMVNSDNIPSVPVQILHFPKTYFRDIMNPFTFYSEDEFKMRYRFSKSTVINVLLPEFIEIKTSNNRGLPIPMEMQILITLRFFGTGSFQTVYADLMYISQGTICNIIRRMSTALAKKLQKYIYFPRGEELQQIKNQFRDLGARRNLPGLPNIVGAIDCTHIKISRPRGIDHTEAYRNRHGWFSINVQAVVDPNMRILDIVSRWPGSSRDSRIFRNSRINIRLTNEEINGILVGDGGYACTPIMLTPLRSPSTTAEENYNLVQIRTRNVVERTFGVLKRRFPCLQRGLGYKLKTTCNIILSCAILHNIALMENYILEDINETSASHIDFTVGATRNEPEGLALRAMLIRNLYSNI